MKKWTKAAQSLFCVFMAFVFVVTSFTFTNVKVSAEEKKYVTVCIERFTIGQGYFVEPTLVEIKDGETAGDALMTLFKEKNIEYESTGSLSEGNLYLAAIKGADTGKVNIPSFITENGGPSNEENDGNSDDYLGEFDYSSMSGWMITVNNTMIDRSCAAYEVKDGDVIRWAFTLWGYGADLGYNTGWGNEPYYSEPDKTQLIKALAQANQLGTSFISYNQSVYDNAYAVASTVEETQTKVDAAKEALVTAINSYSTDNSAAANVKTLSYTIADATSKTADYLLGSVTNPTCGSIGGEWAVLQLARSGKITADFKNTYLSNLSAYVKGKKGVLHSKKLTEYSRVMIALASLGVDATDYEGYNLVKPLADYENTIWQGINGGIFALIALDTLKYEVPAVADDRTQNSREKLISYILSQKLDGGGWALSGTAADPDITAMAIQSLAPYYSSDLDVKAAVDEGLAKLSSLQNEEGGFASWGTVNSESVAQVICALCALGIDPAKDSRFVKEDGSWLLSNLMSFAVKTGDTLSFAHTGTTSNQMATEQAGYALAAYERLLEGKTTLYDMTDTQIKDSTVNQIAAGNTAGISVPEFVENIKGTEFTIQLQADSYADSMKMLDGVVNIPDTIEVTDVSASSNISGGSMTWNVDSGKLRFVYGDLNSGKALTVLSASEKNAVVITCKLKNALKDTDKITVGLNSLREITGSKEYKEMASKTVSVDIPLVTVDVSATVLYTGSGDDLIPADKKAVKVVIAGVDTVSNEIGFQLSSATDYSKLYFSSDFTDYSGERTYLMVVDKNITLEQLNAVENYKIYKDTTMNSLKLADTNGDGVIDAQDALNEVSLWLRKAQKEITSDLILKYNVNGDSSIDSLDALAIVDYFVSAQKFPVIKS